MNKSQHTHTHQGTQVNNTPSKFVFKITLASGGVYFVENADDVLRVVDNNHANKNGRVIRTVEYAPKWASGNWFRRKAWTTGEFRRVDVEELRRHHIEDIYHVDQRRHDARGCIYIAAAILFALIALVGWYVWTN